MTTAAEAALAVEKAYQKDALKAAEKKRGEKEKTNAS